MCGLIRRGCLAATILRIGDKPDIADYDLVLVPRAAASPSADEVIRVARRSLAPRGRLIVSVSGGKARPRFPAGSGSTVSPVCVRCNALA